ncbi:MAG: N-6 DNA methylase [Bacteroidales bacterium]|nr:N-6 DNA methylase [Bacteroidales bacterium]
MIFQKNILKKYAATLPEEAVDAAWTQYRTYFLNADIQQNIRQSNEEQFQEGFLRELFVKVLGYALNPSPNYNLITEQKNETDSKKADGAILKEGKVIGVIELKDHKTSDLAKVEPQVFNYKSQHPEARLVIISNFEKLRLYIDNAVEHREWNLFRMTKEEFVELYLCLAWEQVERGVAIEIKQESVSNEDQITKALYKDYSQFKRALFEDIVKNNPAGEGVDVKEWQLLLFKKTQKLLDRLLFIFFAEDSGLLPPNSMVKIIEQWEKLKELDEYKPLYSRVKKYFGYLDTGHKFKNYELFAYNGGLFKPDEVLDRIEISDEVLVRHTRKLSEYDFESEVDVNILGHIFENSLSEIEAVSQQISNGEAPQTSKRKQDGVFYTPQYITKYIVENTVGRLCTEKKQELDIVEEEYFSDKNRKTETKKRLMERLQAYREWLLGLTILDPACGSGAFLNAALQFLMAEHSLIDEMEAKLTGASIVFQGVENSILENNLYGVDINEESVEIAQLALWLRTAKPHRKLNTLSGNIKCGNSLISDPAVAGEKAFDWEKEFPQVFEKGGFDVVIGNPPYIRPHNLADKDKVYYWNRFSVAQQKTDIYAFFVEFGCSLLKPNGKLGYIIPKTWWSIYSFKKLRELLLNQYNMHQIGLLPQKVFEDATVETALLFVDNTKEQTDISFVDVEKKELIKSISKEHLLSDASYNITYEEEQVLNDVPKLGDLCEVIVGIVTGDDEKYCRFEKLTDLDKPAIRGANISRYGLNYTGEYVWYNREQMIWDGNHKPKSSLKQAVGQSSPKQASDFEIPEKIVLQRIAKRINACLDTNQYYAHSSVVIIKPNPLYETRYILAILNSGFIDKWLRSKSSNISLNAGTLKQIPIPSASQDEQRAISALADTMLTLNAQLQEKRGRFHRRLTENFEGVKITTALQTFDQLDFKAFAAELKKQKIKLTLAQQDDWENYFGQYKQACNDLSSQITATDKEIDAKVYQLYGLTEEEIKTVEAS